MTATIAHPIDGKHAELPKSLDLTDPVFGQIMDMSELAVVMFDMDLKLKYYNKNAIKYFEMNIKDFGENYSYDNIVETLVSNNIPLNNNPDLIKSFITNSMNGESSKAQTETKMTMKSGRHLHVKRELAGDLLIITAKDITQAELHKHTLSIALESGRAGYCTYNCNTQNFKIRSDYLKKQLTQNQMNAAVEKGIFAIMHPDDKQAALDKWTNALKQARLLITLAA